MAKSIKPTLIVIAAMSIPFLLVAGIFLYKSGAMTLRNTMLVLLLAPLAVVVVVLMNKNNNAFLAMPDSVEKRKQGEIDGSSDKHCDT